MIKHWFVQSDNMHKRKTCFNGKALSFKPNDVLPAEFQQTKKAKFGPDEKNTSQAILKFRINFGKVLDTSFAPIREPFNTHSYSSLDFHHYKIKSSYSDRFIENGSHDHVIYE